ncbi:MAG TPA: hypothetical protein VI756_12615 [Blastocatellia bacterium]
MIDPGVPEGAANRDKGKLEGDLDHAMAGKVYPHIGRIQSEEMCRIVKRLTGRQDELGHVSHYCD